MFRTTSSPFLEAFRSDPQIDRLLVEIVRPVNSLIRRAAATACKRCSYGQCGGGFVWQAERVMVIPAGQLQNLETRTVWPFRDVDGKPVW